MFTLLLFQCHRESLVDHSQVLQDGQKGLEVATPVGTVAESLPGEPSLAKPCSTLELLPGDKASGE